MPNPSVERRVLAEDRRARLLLYVSVGAGFAAAALLLAQAWLLSVTVNRIFLRHGTLADVLPLLATMLGLLVVRAGLIWGQEVVVQRAATRTKRAVRQRLLDHLFVLGPVYVRGERSGDLVNTAVEGVEALDEYVTQYQPARLLAGLVPALVFVVVLLLDPWTTPIYLFTGPFLVLLLALIGGRTKAITERRFLEMRWMSAHFLDMLQGLPTLKLFGRSQEQVETIAAISRHYGNTTMEVLRTAFQTSLVLEWGAMAATALVAIEVSLRLMNGLLPFELALTVLLMTPEFFMPLRQLALKYHAGSAGKAAAQRIYAVLDTPDVGRFGKSPSAASATDVGRFGKSPYAALPRFDLRFDAVAYAYDQGQRPALQDLSFSIAHGQMVALVGPTGAGKSTVASLLLRFLSPDRGAIFVGDAPLAAIDPERWRTQVAWVPQRIHLFQGTMGENIALAAPGASHAAIVAAAQAAHAHEFIEALPDGYATPMGEQGARLSGGQRQRIALARAFLKDAPVLILDEATSHLDRVSEELIQDALERLRRGRTVLVIAHRLEMVTAADQIVVIDQGHVVEAGSHSSLLAQGGLYRQLVDVYAGGAA